MTVTETQLSPDDVVSRGKALYENDIQAQVEEGNIGRLLMVDVTTGNWVMGENRIEMTRRLRARNPQAQDYGMRIGYAAAIVIGASMQPSVGWDRTGDKTSDFNHSSFSDPEKRPPRPLAGAVIFASS